MARPPETTRQRFWRNFPVRTGHALLNWLLLAIPVTLLMEYVFHPQPLVIFGMAALSIIPLAGALGDATEELAAHTGDKIGGFLNATLGNATELIIAFFALRAGHVEIVKASLSGSIIGNSLLVLGAAVLVGGIGRERQTFSRQEASINATMLFIAVVALVMPAVYDLVVYGHLEENTPVVQHLSLGTSIILFVVYLLSVLFTLKTNVARGATGEQAAAAHRALHPEDEGGAVRSMKSALIALVVTTIFIGVLSEILVAQLEVVKQQLGWSDLFLGVIVIAIIGNAAEHSTAILVAYRNKMDMAITIAAGSSAQIALLVAPLLVFASWALGTPMSLVFTGLEIAGIAVSVIILEMIASDGETTWFEGVMLLAVYAILGIVFFYMPAHISGH